MKEETLIILNEMISDFSEWFSFIPQRLDERVLKIIGSMTIELRSRENRPNELPHLHVRNDCYDGVFLIENGEVERESSNHFRLSSKTKKEIKDWILQNQERLIGLWNSNCSSPIIFDLEQYNDNGKIVCIARNRS